MSEPPTSWLYLSGIWLRRKGKWKDQFFPLPSSSLFGNGKIVPFITEQDSLWRPPFLNAYSTLAALAHGGYISDLVFPVCVFHGMHLSLGSMTMQHRALTSSRLSIVLGSAFRIQNAVSKSKNTIYTSLYVQPSLFWAEGLYCLSKMFYGSYLFRKKDIFLASQPQALITSFLTPYINISYIYKPQEMFKFYSLMPS